MFRQAVWDEPLLLELGRPGRRGFSLPRVMEENAERFIPETMRRQRLVLPSLSEPQVVRHFTRLSQMNFGVDSGPYFLGSCTMKYNPKICQRLASLPSILDVHPLQDEDAVQGILEVMYRLQGILAEITGMDAVSLVPAAGAQGEFLGCLIIKHVIEKRGETGVRNEMLVPDSAHGTNPASAAQAGFKVLRIPSGDDGLVDLEKLAQVCSEKTAGMMLTVPNTLGLFEKDILRISSMIHDVGGLMYYYGANMNALVGRARPGDMGFDIAHLNLHKTFSTPHGGGGPGAGPVGVKKELSKYLPPPKVDFDGRKYRLGKGGAESIGSIKSFHGNVGVLLRAYIYILMMGKDGLEKTSEQAVLASNYLLRKLDHGSYSLPHSPQSVRKHEFVVSAAPLRKGYGIRASDIAKSLLDAGVHPPTIYFPLTVDEALMIEPTETETQEDLDNYAEALNGIASRSRSDPSLVKSSPKNTSIGRLDEVKASHPLTIALNWRGIRSRM